jgi:hypothetical protein
MNMTLHICVRPRAYYHTAPDFLTRSTPRNLGSAQMAGRSVGAALSQLKGGGAGTLLTAVNRVSLLGIYRSTLRALKHYPSVNRNGIATSVRTGTALSARATPLSRRRADACDVCPPYMCRVAAGRSSDR